MHNEIREWMMYARALHPDHFKHGEVLDVGAQDINGTNRWLFGPACHYMGIDLVAGRNVDIVMPVHHYAAENSPEKFDVIVSTDCLEHDRYWRESLAAMYRLLKVGGLMVFTCAGQGRDEHGTETRNPAASPGTLDYYGNLTPSMIEELALDVPNCFASWKWDCHPNTMGPGLDTRFWGIKK